MNLTISSPPRLTGESNIDIERLHSWCCTLQIQLKRVLCAIGNDNIISISPEKLESGCTSITADSFTLSSPDGEQFIKCVNGNIEINANRITAKTLITDEGDN